MAKYIFYFFIILLSIFFSFKLKDSYKNYQLLKEEVLKLENRKDNLLKEKEILENNLNTNKEKALEREARVMLDLKKQGEKVIMIIPPKEFTFERPSLKENNLNIASERTSFLKEIWYNIYKFFKMRQ